MKTLQTTGIITCAHVTEDISPPAPDEARRPDGPTLAISPDTLMLCRSGHVVYNRASFDGLSNRDFIPPEYLSLPQGAPISDSAIEKVYVWTRCGVYMIIRKKNLSSVLKVEGFHSKFETNSAKP